MPRGGSAVKKGLPFYARPVTDPEASEAGETARQRVLRWLRRDEYSFDELRLDLQIPARELEDTLRHVEKTVRARGGRLEVIAPECRDCGFGFPGRARKHLHPPGRCPECRSYRIESPRVRVCEG